jgi:type VI secretion system protein ImpL
MADARTLMTRRVPVALPGLQLALTWAGVAAASALVWFVGPLVAINGVVPLAGEPARWGAIAAVVALAAVYALWRAARASRRNRRLLDGLVAGAASARAPGEAEVAEVSQRFEQAVSLLRRSRLGGAKRSWRAWLGAKPFVYELPWYIIIGAPGAGKTTALVNSGLEFPLAPTVGQAAVRGVGGTRNCDWWFTNEAVLIDTAGRYTTHDSDRAADRAAWFGFLGLLARHRPRRPIDGVLLTLSVSDLLGASPERRIAHAAELRERIEELHERLGIAFPVYVLVTKTDLLAGFMEFFADFDKDERAQVWGVTFAYQTDATREGPQQMLASEFAAIEKRLNDCLLDRLSGESERDRRAAIQAFPQQWRLLRQTLFDFLQILLGDLRAELRPLVRGVYFTSATQEGTPMDRALGGLVRALGLPGQVLPPARPSGKTFFVTRLLREVVFAEAGLAGSNLRWLRRRRQLEWSLLALCVCGVVAVGFVAWRAYADNRATIDALAARLPALRQTLAGAKAAPGTDLLALLPALDSLYELRSAQGAASSPARFALGLDRREMLGSATDDAYLHALREGLQPRIAARVQAELQSADPGHVDLIYDALKAYLMLFGGRNFDRQALRAYLLADWESTLSASASAAQRESLGQHLERLLASGELGAPSNADAQLVARARALVASVPLAQRAFQRLKQIDPGPNAPAFSVESMAGANARRVFARASGESLASGVPALYSRAVLAQGLRERTQEVLRQLSTEQAWVLGLSGGNDAAPRDAPALQGVADEVQRQYLAEYAARWAAFVGDIRLAPTSTLAASAEQADLLSRPDSPLLSFLRAAVREVSFDAAQDPLGGRFEALRQLVSGQPAPIEATQALLAKLAAQLAAVDDAVQRKVTPPAADAIPELAGAVARSPEPLRSMLAQLAGASAIQLFAALREPLARQLASDVTAPCSRDVAGQYPLQRNASADISREAFTRAFAAGGVLDGFFQHQLLPYVDTSAQPWAFRGSANRNEGGEALQQFHRARGIRDAFFRDGGRRLGMQLELRALEFDPGIAELTLDVDGQVLRFRPGQRAPQSLQWPGPQETGRVQLQLTPTVGAAGPGYSFQGPWALLRLLDRVRSEPGSAPDRSLLTFDIEGRKARFELKSPGGADPLARAMLEQFKCPSRF